MQAEEASAGEHRPGLVPTTPSLLSVRAWGAVLFALTFAEGTLGVLSAGQSRTLPSDLLAAHVITGIGLVALSVWVLVRTWRFTSRPARLATAFTVGALAGTAGTGAIFLLTGAAQVAMVDRGLAILSLVGTALMMVWGSERCESVA